MEPGYIVVRSIHFASRRTFPPEPPVYEGLFQSVWMRSNGYCHIYLAVDDVNESIDFTFRRSLIVMGEVGSYLCRRLAGKIARASMYQLDLGGIITR